MMKSKKKVKKYLQANAKTQPYKGFPGGAVVKNLPASARDTGSSPGPGRSNMPWSNSLCATTTKPVL